MIKEMLDEADEKTVDDYYGYGLHDGRYQFMWTECRGEEENSNGESKDNSLQQDISAEAAIQCKDKTVSDAAIVSGPSGGHRRNLEVKERYL